MNPVDWALNCLDDTIIEVTAKGTHFRYQNSDPMTWEEYVARTDQKLRMPSLQSNKRIVSPEQLEQSMLNSRMDWYADKQRHQKAERERAKEEARSAITSRRSREYSAPFEEGRRVVVDPEVLRDLNIREGGSK